MARPNYLLLVLVALLGTALSVSAQEPRFDRVQHDFGPIPRGPTQSTSFQLTNKSAKPIYIGSVRIPCSCVSASIAKRDLAAGESTTVDLQLDTRRVSGQLEKSVFVIVDREEVRLTVKADIRNDLVLSPETLAFGRVKKGGAADADVTVLLAGNSQAKVLEAKSDSGFVTAKVQQLPAESGGTSYRVTAHLLPGLAPGYWYTTVWLRTDNPAMTRFPIGVTVEVQDKKN